MKIRKNIENTRKFRKKKTVRPKKMSSLKFGEEIRKKYRKFVKILRKIQKNTCEKIGNSEKYQKLGKIPKIWKNTEN